MKIVGNESERAILKELGNRIRQQRVSMNITQDQLARICGISTSTEVRIENGDDSKISNIIKIMAALGISENMDLLIPEGVRDYKAIFEEKPVRKRASSKKRRTKVQWTWGEDR